MIRFITSFFGAIFTFLTLGALIGVLAVGGVLWFYSRDLPSHESLAQYTPATISRIYSTEGQIIDEFAHERRLYVPIEDVPAIVKQAFIAAEDQNFYTHKGYDAKGMAAAFVEAVVSRGQRVRGASTITQQVMKNFLLGGEKTGERKIKELILATRIEETLSKDKILELYLNEIFLGQNSYGVAAAAQTYFNKPLHALAIEEAAVLASLPTQPSNFHPVRGREKLLERRAYVLRRMMEDGYITRVQHDQAVLAPLRTVQGGDYVSFRQALPPRDYFTDEIRRQLSSSFGEKEFFGGGLTIRATVDPELQQIAAKALRDGLEKYDRGLGIWRGTRKSLEPAALASEAGWRDALARLELPRDVEGWFPAVVLELTRNTARIGIEGQEGADHEIPAADVTWARKRLENGRLGPKAKVPADLLEVGDVVLVRAVTKDGAFQRWSLRQVPEIQGAFMAMDVNNGRVISMQGGFSYQDTVFNRATQAQRQPGSSFKPFVYAAALDNGFSPATIVVDAPIEVNTPQGIWKPKNASNRFYGPTPVRTGIEQSRNLMTVRIAQEIGMDVVAEYAERFGVYKNMGHFLSNSLGSEETTLAKMVAAYAMFANGGERVEPTLVDRVQDRWGRTIYRHDQRKCENCSVATLGRGEVPKIDTRRERVMDPITAYQLTSMMEGVVLRGTGRGISVGAPVAGKTGTTNDAKDVWFVGYTSNIAAGCYIGYDTPRSLGSASGGGMCGPVFQAFMREAVKKYGSGKFKVPPGGYWVKIDRHTGMRLDDSASGENVISEYFREGQEDLYGFGSFVDGGFAMGSNLPLFAYGESDGSDTTTMTTATGETRAIPKKADFGTVSSGGLY
ncbi:penicillin-binding protein 1A [Falsigemmobacter intermedius]|uniref:Penicillin-binding protein 1A n=1 Tax=Falsigemmobacter intermedius TaxID=1553448 RepID=A0A444MDP6_9RHOB|nr:penicillin-binding protein 1A [Falsigemmobacter intermedius]RWY42943.1 penicillin-binding protein 1A [Falsigemmobacter intermedius]